MSGTPRPPAAQHLAPPEYQARLPPLQSCRGAARHTGLIGPEKLDRRRISSRGATSPYLGIGACNIRRRSEAESSVKFGRSRERRGNQRGSPASLLGEVGWSWVSPYSRQRSRNPRAVPARVSYPRLVMGESHFRNAQGGIRGPVDTVAAARVFANVRSVEGARRYFDASAIWAPGRTKCATA